MTMGSVKERSDDVSQKADGKSHMDPADYIFSHKEYHDRVLIVGKSDGETERISIVTCYLMSQSSVFRERLIDSDSDVYISDVSPDIFKLILIHVYGGKLPPMNQGKIAQLALAACLYNIRPLVTKASKLIEPKSAEDVYAALVCSANAHCPNLDRHVIKIIQYETKAVLDTDQFLDLDAKCLEYICRQDKLSVTERELWRALVRWANKKVISEPEKTRRQHLQTILPYVRLNTFSSAEVGQEVCPANILTAEEVMKLITAVSNNQPWELLGICSIREERELLDGTKDDAANPPSEAVESETVVKNSSTYVTTITKHEDGLKSISNFTVNTAEKQVEILSFQLESNPIETLGNQPVYNLKCTVTVSKIEGGFCKETFVVEIGGKVIGSSDINFALKLRNEQPLVLEAQSVYNFALEFNTPHPVYTLTKPLESPPKSPPESTPKSPPESTPDSAGITVKYNTPLHVKKFCYQI